MLKVNQLTGFGGKCKGRSLLAMAMDTGSTSIAVYSLNDLTRLTSLPSMPGSGVNGIGLSPNGRLLAAAYSVSPYIDVYDLIPWTKNTVLASPPAGLGMCCAFSPDGKFLAVGHYTTPFVSIYNTGDWSKVANPASLPAEAVRSIAFSPDSSKLAVGTEGAKLWIYNTGDWSRSAPAAHPGAGQVRGLSFSRNGTWIACAHLSYPYMTVYTVSDLAKLAAPSVVPLGSSLSCAFSPDSSLLVFSAAVSGPTFNTIVPYSTADWSVKPMAQPSGTVERVAFNGDGSRLYAVLGTGGVKTYSPSDFTVLANPSSLLSDCTDVVAT